MDTRRHCPCYWTVGRITSTLFTLLNCYASSKKEGITNIVLQVQNRCGRDQDPGLFCLQPPGAGFMKGLKSGLRLKSETLGSNVVNILLSLWTQTQSISQTGST